MTHEKPLEKANLSFASMHSVLLRTGVVVHFLCSVLGSHLAWTCADPATYCHRVCEFIWASILLCLSDRFSWHRPSPLAPKITLSPLLHSDLIPEGRSWMKTLKLSTTKSLSVQCPVVRLCISSYLLREEVSLRTTKQGTDLWVKKKRVLLGAILLYVLSAEHWYLVFPWAHGLSTLRLLAV